MQWQILFSGFSHVELAWVLRKKTVAGIGVIMRLVLPF